MTAASKDQRTGWLRELLAGDEVGVLSPAGPGYREVCRVATVERVSPTGRMTAGSYVFASDGSVRSSDRYDRQRLVPAAEARAWVEHDEAIVALRLAALGLSEAVRERRAQRLTTSAAQQLTVQIGALAEAVRVALGNETPPSAAGGDR